MACRHQAASCVVILQPLLLNTLQQRTILPGVHEAGRPFRPRFSPLPTTQNYS